MPIARINEADINYAVVGEAGPWLALTTGGRRGFSEFAGLAAKLAGHGFRVLLHDRRNTGASDVVIAGEASEESIWVDDLHGLLSQLGALPAFIGGSSSGSRLSMLFGLRYPEAVRGLLLFRVTGGAVAAGRLPGNYYGQFVAAARQGGMAAVCATEHYRGCIAANPANGARLMAMDPADYIAVMTRWQTMFEAGVHHEVAGLTNEQLQSIRLPTLVIPGNDQVHNSTSGRAAHRLIPGSEWHQLPLEDQDVVLIPFDEWEPQEAEIASVFAGFMHRVAAEATK